MAEWLRRWTANPLGSARVGSNPILVVIFSFLISSPLFAIKSTTPPWRVIPKCITLAFLGNMPSHAFWKDLWLVRQNNMIMIMIGGALRGHAYLGSCFEMSIVRTAMLEKLRPDWILFSILIGYNINVGPVHYLCRGKSCLPYFNLAWSFQIHVYKIF